MSRAQAKESSEPFHGALPWEPAPAFPALAGPGSQGTAAGLCLSSVESPELGE